MNPVLLTWLFSLFEQQFHIDSGCPYLEFNIYASKILNFLLLKPKEANKWERKIKKKKKNEGGAERNLEKQEDREEKIEVEITIG